MVTFIEYLFRDAENAKLTIAVGGTIIAAIGFGMVLVGAFLVR